MSKRICADNGTENASFKIQAILNEWNHVTDHHTTESEKRKFFNAD